MLASLSLIFGNMVSLALDVLLLFSQLALYVLLALWLLNRVPARCQAVLDFLSSLLAFGDPAAPAAPARSPARPLSAPDLASAPPPPSAGRLSASFWASGTPQTFAWDRRSISDTSSLADKESLQRFDDWYQRRVRESQQKKTVRFAPEVQVQTIPSRHSVAHPEPVSAVAPPPVAEPWDAAAWSARLEAFHKAISMPNCSLFPDPKLVLGVAAPVQQQAPLWRAEIVQQAPAAPAPLPSPPKASAPPASAPRAANTTACQPEKLRQGQAPQAHDLSTFSFDRSAMSHLYAATTPEGLTEAQQQHRATMQKVVRFLDAIRHNAVGLRSGTADERLASAWQRSVRFATVQASLSTLAASLREVQAAGKKKGDGGLDESVFPRGGLEMMLLKGRKMDEMVEGFERGQEKVLHSKTGDGVGCLVAVLGALTEMRNFFGQY